jgi:hypothetical protein
MFNFNILRDVNKLIFIKTIMASDNLLVYVLPKTKDGTIYPFQVTQRMVILQQKIWAILSRKIHRRG